MDWKAERKTHDVTICLQKACFNKFYGQKYTLIGQLEEIFEKTY